MSKILTVIPEQCSGCRLCELTCAIKHHNVNNPKKAAIRVMITYPHPVIRMPVVCSQCKKAPCEQACPVNAIKRINEIVVLDKDTCISCNKCVRSCPFGAIYVHADCDHPLKCDMCSGDPECVKVCPKNALKLIPEYVLGETKRVSNVLSYTQMKEIEFYEKGEARIIHYAEIGKEEL